MRYISTTIQKYQMEARAVFLPKCAFTNENVGMLWWAALWRAMRCTSVLQTPTNGQMHKARDVLLAIMPLQQLSSSP